MASEGISDSKIFGKEANTQAARDKFRAAIGSHAKDCAGKVPSQDLVNSTAALFSRGFLVCAAQELGLTVTASATKGAIIQQLFKQKWVIPSDDEARKQFKETADSGQSGDSEQSTDESNRNTSKDTKPEESDSSGVHGDSESDSHTHPTPREVKNSDSSQVRMKDKTKAPKGTAAKIPKVNLDPILTGIVSKLASESSSSSSGSKPEGSRSSSSTGALGDYPSSGDEGAEEASPESLPTNFLIAKLTEAITASTRVSEALAEAQAGKGDSSTSLVSAKVKKALKKGEFVSIFHFLDHDIARLRAETITGSRVWRKPTDLDYVDLHDYCLALSKIGEQYSIFGHQNLSIQVLNLLGAVLTLTATYQRVSVMKAIERVRQQTTSPRVQWDSESAFHKDCRTLLRPISGPSKSFSGKRKWGTLDATVTKGNHMGDFKSRSKVSTPERLDGGASSQCLFWAQGSDCPYGSKCRYRHSCDSCGKPRFHDAVSCKLASFKDSKNQWAKGYPKGRRPL